VPEAEIARPPEPWRQKGEWQSIKQAAELWRSEAFVRFLLLKKGQDVLSRQKKIDAFTAGLILS
jgi:hypothetical protein